MREMQRYFRTSRMVTVYDPADDEAWWEKSKEKWRVGFERDKEMWVDAGAELGPTRYREYTDTFYGRTGVWYAEVIKEFEDAISQGS